MTTPTQDMTEDQRSVLSKIERLLRLASNNPNPEEAASAAKKAQDLLLAYNLDASAIGSGEDGRRGEEKLRGGFYKYERDLMSRIADVNFCLHWVSSDLVPRDPKDAARKKVRERYSAEAQAYRRQTRHHLVGKRVSVMATRQMFDYLSATIERLTRDFLGLSDSSAEDRLVGAGASLRSKRATDFRRGVALELEHKLWDRRQGQMAEERKARAAEEARAAEAAAAGASSATTLTIASVRQSEEDANYDVLYGEGWSARRRAAQAERAAARKAAEEELTRWAAENPEEAKRQAEEERKERQKAERRRARREERGGGYGRRSKRDDTDWGAFTAGQRAGRTVGLDPQAEHSSAPRKIGRG